MAKRIGVIVLITGIVFAATIMLWAQSRTTNRPGHYEIVGTDAGTFLLDTRTGDTWEWYFSLSTSYRGWQYHSKTTRRDGSTIPTDP